MKTRRTRKQPSKLTLARREFARWRKRRKAGERIPKELWRRAVELAEELGINPTARALRLDYYSLKKRVDREAVSASSATPVTSEFVEIPAAAIAATGECVVEVERPGGARMRLHLKGSFATELAAAVGAFTKA